MLQTIIWFLNTHRCGMNVISSSIMKASMLRLLPGKSLSSGWAGRVLSTNFYLLVIFLSVRRFKLFTFLQSMNNLILWNSYSTIWLEFQMDWSKLYWRRFPAPMGKQQWQECSWQSLQSILRAVKPQFAWATRFRRPKCITSSNKNSQKSQGTNYKISELVLCNMSSWPQPMWRIAYSS